MEKPAAKKVGSSSSSFTVDLFGPKESSKSSSSSTCVFGSIFGPPTSMQVPGRESSNKDYGHTYSNAKHETTTDNYKNQKGKKGKNSKNEKGRVEPCYYNSSINYGGQQNYSQNITPPHNFKKDDGGNVGANESNSSSSASRGNWWQGSLYY